MAESASIPVPGQDTGGRLACPACNCEHFFVVYVRRRAGMIVRRRECRHCGKRFMTYEKMAANHK